ncbi:MAG: type IX secretion system membrane protein PorP/SprF, partial [Bacteroidales bacterium]
EIQKGKIKGASEAPASAFPGGPGALGALAPVSALGASTSAPGASALSSARMTSARISEAPTSAMALAPASARTTSARISEAPSSASAPALGFRASALLKASAFLFALFFFFFLGSIFAWGQNDAPLNPTFDLPLLLNPAMAGLGTENFDGFGGMASALTSRKNKRSSQSFLVHYKNQLSGAFSASSLKIISASYENLFFKKRMALGVDVYSNTLNNTALTDLSVMITYAYHWNIIEDMYGNPQHRLSFGLQAGYRQWSFNVEKMHTGSMYDPSYTGGYNPSLSVLDPKEQTNKNLFDAQFGLYYTGVLSSSFLLHLGASAWHIFRPETGFLFEKERTPVKWVAYADVVWKFGGETGTETGLSTGSSDLKLHGFYNYQGGWNLWELGLNYQYHFTSDYSLALGFGYRSGNVFLPIIMADIKNFTLKFQMECNATYAVNNLFAIGLGYRW